MACTQVTLDIKQCSLCNEQLSHEESFGRGQCKICLCKKVQLVQVFGKWPVPAFVKFTGLQQITFWKEARTCTKRFDLEALLVKQISSVRVDMFDTSGGAFKPLSIYAREGYSNEALVNIEKNSCSRWDEELEMYTYKLVVVEERKAAIYRGVEQELIEWKHSSALRQKMLPYGSPASKKKRKRTKSSTSSSSSNSKGSHNSKECASGMYKSKGSEGSVCELSPESDSESPRSKARRAKAEAEATLRAEKQAAEVQRNNDKQAKVAAAEAKKADAAEAKKQAALVKEQKAQQTAAGKELAKAAKKKVSDEAQAAKKKASEDIPCNV